MLYFPIAGSAKRPAVNVLNFALIFGSRQNVGREPMQS